MAGKDVVVGGAFKNKVMAAASNITPDPIIAEQGRKLSEPGTAAKVPPKKRAS